MRYFDAILLVCASVVWAQRRDSALNDLLANDVQMDGPGVRARLTPKGTSYVSTIVANVLTKEIVDTVAPQEQRVHQLPSLDSLKLSDVQLHVFSLPNSFHVVPVEPNQIQVNLRNMNLSMIARASGSVREEVAKGRVNIKTPHFGIDVTISLKKNQHGNPHMEVESCEIPRNIPIMLAMDKPLATRNGQFLAESLTKEGHLIFEEVICTRLSFILESRLNQRFNLLSSKITLGESAKFDLVSHLIAADNERRRKMRNKFRKSLRLAARDSPLGRNRENSRSAAVQKLMVRSPRASQLHDGEMKAMKRIVRQKVEEGTTTFLSSFNLSRADVLVLNYGMLTKPIVSMRGLEIETSGEISAPGHETPFGARPIALPSSLGDSMLQLAVSDFVPNSLMYHGHRIGLFNTRVDSRTPQFGGVMRTSCDLSTGSLFCVGDLFPTLRDTLPGREVAMLFSTIQAPAVVVRPENEGGILFGLHGLIDMLSIDPMTRGERPIGSMEIAITATMKMKLGSTAVKGKVSLNEIKLTSRTPAILVQEELDDAAFLSREILQRMVNDILKQGIPIPVHPLFRLQKPKLTLTNRAMILETNFKLNENLIRQLTAHELRASN